jgi:hypothetical protein
MAGETYALDFVLKTLHLALVMLVMLGIVGLVWLAVDMQRGE